MGPGHHGDGAVTRRRLGAALTVLVALAVVGTACGDDSDSSSDGSGSSTTTAAGTDTLAAVSAEDASDDALIRALPDLLVAEDLDGLDEFLSPAFTLVRSDGTSYDKEQYLESPAQIDAYDVEDIEGTRDGDVRVVRATFLTEGELDGREIVQQEAPRLATFVWNGELWQLAAYANFSAVESEEDVVVEAPDAPDPDLDPEAVETATPFFQLLVEGDRDGLAEFLSDAWMIQRTDGNYLDKAGYLADLPTVEGYEFYDLSMTEVDDVRVIHIFVAVDAAIDGEPLTTAPSPYLSAFVRDGDSWRMISHANLTPLTG